MHRPRTLLRVATAVSLMVTPSISHSSASAAAKPSTWTQIGHDATGSFYNPNETVLNSRTLPKVKLRWKVPIPYSTCSTDKGPLISGKQVFLFSGDRVRALDAATGIERWQSVSLANRFVGALMIVDGVVVLSSSVCHDVGPAGRIDGYSATTGQLIWSYSDDISLGRVIADRGIILGADPSQGAMVVIDAKTGSKLWERRPTSESERAYLNWENPTAGGRVLVWKSSHPDPQVPSSLGTEALDISTGVTLWSSPYTWFGVAASPSGDKFFVHDVRSSLLRGVDAGTGRVLWTIDDWQASQFSADDRSLYVSSSDVVYRVDSRTGKILWTRDTKRDLGQPMRAGGLLYVPRVKALLVLDPATGVKKSAPAIIAGGQYIPVAIAGGRLYATTAAFPQSLVAFAP